MKIKLLFLFVALIVFSCKPKLVVARLLTRDQ